MLWRMLEYMFCDDRLNTLVSSDGQRTTLLSKYQQISYLEEIFLKALVLAE